MEDKRKERKEGGKEGEVAVVEKKKGGRDRGRYLQR